jgi:hypothetical protein
MHHAPFGPLVLSMLLVTVIGSTVLAADIPPKYRGVWSTVTCDLPKSAEEFGEYPYVVIAPDGYSSHETSCTIMSVSKAASINSDVLTFSCSSEGERLTTKEIWSLTEKRWFNVSQTFLERKGGDIFNAGTFKKCGLTGTRQRILD